MNDLLSYPIGVPFVHVGTRESAAILMLDKYEYNEDFIYLYEVTLTEDATLNSEVFADMNDWPELVEDHLLDGDACRYVNRWEGAGSISLLVDPRKLRMECVDVIPIGEVRKFVVDTIGADHPYLIPC